MLARWFRFCGAEDADPHDDESVKLSRALRDFNFHFERGLKLIFKGANPNTESVTGHSILQLAAMTQPEWIPLLLTLGADPHKLNSNHRDVFETCFRACTNHFVKAEALLAIIQYSKVSPATLQVFHNWLISRFAIIAHTLKVLELRESKWTNASYVYKQLSPITLRLAIYHEATRHSQRLELARRLIVLFAQTKLQRLPTDLILLIFKPLAEHWFNEAELKQLIEYVYVKQLVIRNYLKAYQGLQFFYQPEVKAAPFQIQAPLSKLWYDYQLLHEKRQKAARNLSPEKEMREKQQQRKLQQQFRCYQDPHAVGLFKNPLNQLSYRERLQSSAWANDNAKHNKVNP